MTLPPEMSIDRSRTKAVLMILGAAAFVALGLWMFSLPDAEILPEHDPIFVHGIALLCVGFFGLCAFAGIKSLFDTGPGLQFTRQGMVWNFGSPPLGLIPWSDITGFDVYKVKSTRMLVVQLVDPLKYADRGNIIRQRLAHASMNMCGSPLSLSAGLLKISFDELRELSEAYLARYGVKRAA